MEIGMTDGFIKGLIRFFFNKNAQQNACLPGRLPLPTMFCRIFTLTLSMIQKNNTAQSRVDDTIGASSR